MGAFVGEAVGRSVGFVEKEPLRIVRNISNRHAYFIVLCNGMMRIMASMNLHFSWEGLLEDELEDELAS